MVAKNNAGAQANLSSSDPLAYASSSDTRGDTPLQYGSRECNEVTAHPNELWEPSDELNDVSSPDQAFQWLIDREFPSKFAQTMRDGRFNGPMILDLFGCASTIKEAMEIFKGFELALPCLLVGTSASARGGCRKQPE